MKNRTSNYCIGRALSLLCMLAISITARAEIPGLELNVVKLYAKQAQISTPDGDSLRIWGFADSPDGPAQYPGPTIIVNEGDMVEITVYNVDVPQPVSLVFPGQTNISKTCDIGVLTPSGCHGTFAEGANVVAADNGVQSITYTFTATRPGTFLYESGENPQIQVDMGLAGALIVRPQTPATRVDAGGGLVYNDPATAYDKEYLFFMSEMDPKLHYLAENNALDQWDNASYKSVLFFFNGRNAPDTLAPHFVPELPHQPYGSLVTMFPGQRVLLRVINIGRNQHPLHTHGNHFRQVGRDGFPLNAAVGDYTQNVFPGSTADLIFEWTGKNMGWDIYNPESPHACVDTLNNRTGVVGDLDGYDDNSWEWCADHGKTMPVVLPENQDLGFGGFYGGSPYLGDMGTLPVGEGGLNPSGGMAFMWHSHSERELTNNDIYPGGMLTMMIVNRRQ